VPAVAATLVIAAIAAAGLVSPKGGTNHDDNDGGLYGRHHGLAGRGLLSPWQLDASLAPSGTPLGSPGAASSASATEGGQRPETPGGTLPPVLPDVFPAIPDDVKGIVCAYDWDCGTALRIVWCESRGDASATSGTSWGLFQLWAGHAGRWPDFWDNWADPYWNTARAYELWQEQGWGPWECY